MHLRKKWIILIALIVAIAATNFASSHYSGFNSWYCTYIYYPLQVSRCFLFDFVPFSIGDIAYIAAGASLLFTLLKWAYFVSKFKRYKINLAASLLNMINVVLAAYLFFLVGWGANYDKPPLRTYWQLPFLSFRDTKLIVAFDEMLVDQLNTYAPHYQTLSLNETNERSKLCYQKYTDSKLKRLGLHVKPSLFGYFMERVGVDGYYNPFTGEGQVDNTIPAFMRPFVLCHEMAHQAGIAAEDDANLMAYALGTTGNDSTFRYSAYLNIWLYAYHRLYRRDSVAAKNISARLNKLTIAHLDTLEQVSRLYHNGAANATNEIYDSYLKMQDQKDGIRSYGNVAYTAWLLEMKRGKDTDMILKIS